MTTSNSPLHILRDQAKKSVRALKTFPWAEGQTELKFAIAMDDKIIAVVISKEKIVDSPSEALEELFLSYMRGETVQ